MSESRLLIAVVVFEFLRTLAPREQAALLKRFREIAVVPSRFADYAERDSATGALMFTYADTWPSSIGTISPTGM